MNMRMTGLCLALLLLAGCATTQKRDDIGPRYTPDLLTEDEIAASGAANAYDLIRNLRPHWLQGRGRKSIMFDSASVPVVYVNGNRYGDVNSLASISKDNITLIEFLNAGDATTLLGVNHPSGAIMITIYY